MKFKDGVKKVAKVIGLWLLGYAKTFWEEKLKDLLREQIKLLAAAAIEEVEKLHDSVEYELKRDEIFDKIFNELKLPVVLRPFKWLIKMILKDAVEKKIKDTLDKLKEKI